MVASGPEEVQGRDVTRTYRSRPRNSGQRSRGRPRRAHVSKQADVRKQLGYFAVWYSRWCGYSISANQRRCRWSMAVDHRDLDHRPDDLSCPPRPVPFRGCVAQSRSGHHRCGTKLIRRDRRTSCHSAIFFGDIPHRADLRDCHHQYGRRPFGSTTRLGVAAPVASIRSTYCTDDVGHDSRPAPDAGGHAVVDISADCSAFRCHALSDSTVGSDLCHRNHRILRRHGSSVTAGHSGADFRVQLLAGGIPIHVGDATTLR